MGLQDRDYLKKNSKNYYRNNEAVKNLKQFKNNKKTSILKNLMWSLALLGGLFALIEIFITK